ncbi:BRCA1-associated RING domain protein 1 [Anthophora plagiata]
MNTSWKNTREALRKFAIVLTCYKCGSQPINASRYTSCGHTFCKQCIENDSICLICNTYVQPQEIFNDHLVESLISYCNILAGVIQEKDLWPAKTNPSTREPLPMVKETWTVNNTWYIPKKNINKQNDKGETLLHRICLKNQVDYVKALLAAGANPNTKDHSGWTPLQEVVNFGYTVICQVLLENNASPNIPGAGNRTPLHDAAMNNNLLEAKLLLQYSASKNVYDDHGKKPIDYCKPYTDMWNILKDENELNDVTDGANLNCTLNQSLSVTRSFNTLVVYALNLREENKRYLDQMALKYKFKIVPAFQSSVTHVIMEANNKNIVKLSYDVMMALLRGCWLLNTEWIQLGMDMGDMLTGDLEIFEISGTPIVGIPRKAKENAQSQNPGLFDKCSFYFTWQSKNAYSVNNIQLTKDALTTLVQEGGGKILKREPRPEDTDSKEQLIPFHVANNPSHSLYKCTHYIIYIPGRDEPRLKYNMSRIKTLPLMWLIECVEKFTLIDPLQLGLL